MPRRKIVTPKYKITARKNSRHSEMVQKFINCLMLDGKKTVSERIFFDAVKVANKNNGKDPQDLDVFYKAMESVSPELEVRARRIGGATYQVPCEVRPDRKRALAIRWIIGAARAKKGKPMAARLADEFIAASKNEGTAYKKKVDTHKMAEANKAFAHYKW